MAVSGTNNSPVLPRGGSDPSTAYYCLVGHEYEQQSSLCLRNECFREIKQSVFDFSAG